MKNQARRHHHHHRIRHGFLIETNPPLSPAFKVLYQKDKNVVYLGNAWAGPNPAANMPGYSATVKKNGVVVRNYAVPRHDWNARWVDDLLPDTIIMTPAQMVAANLIFPYGDPGQNPPNAPTNAWSGPMGTGGITTTQGITGERPDIGLLPEWEAYFLRTGAAGPMMAAAKGFDSYPMWRIDQNTGRLVDPTKYPYASPDYRTDPSVRLTYAPGLNDDMSQYPPGTLQGQWGLDGAHHPACYIPYLATRKLRYLEVCQANALWPLQANNWFSTTDGKNRCIIHMLQARNAGWSLRSLVAAWRATVEAERDYPAGLPVPLLPSSVFKTVLDWNMDYITKGYMQDPACQFFGFWPDKTSFRPWQFDYIFEAVAFAVLVGAGQGWTDLLIWMLNKNAVPRLAGKSGYAQAWQTPYELWLGKPISQGGTMPEGSNGFPFDVPASAFFQNGWQGVMDFAFTDSDAAFKAGATSYYNMSQPDMAALKADPTGGGDFINWDSYTPKTLRCVMVGADHLDKQGLAPITAQVPDFALARDNIVSMVSRWAAKSPSNVIESRVSVMAA